MRSSTSRPAPSKSPTRACRPPTKSRPKQPNSSALAALLVVGDAFEPLPGERSDKPECVHSGPTWIFDDPFVDLPQRIGQLIALDPDQVRLSIVVRIITGFGDGDGVLERVGDPMHGVVVKRPLKFAGAQSVHRQIAVLVLVA